MATYDPLDFLRGSKTIGQKYTSWNTYGQGKPDMGVGAGPGEPYHEVVKKVPNQISPPNNWGLDVSAPEMVGQKSQVSGTDPRIEAIRRRLRGL
jgi:hypothetical protein